MKRWFYAFIGLFRRDQVVVVVWGVHAPEWMAALAPLAPVWKRIPAVRAVVHYTSAEQNVPRKTRSGRRLVVLPLMEDHIGRRPARYQALVPTSEAVEILRDKRRFADYVARQGLSAWCPPLYPSLQEARFPCVIKRTDLNGGHGIEMAESFGHAQEVLAGSWLAGSPYIIQARVVCSTEYVVHCVCLKGRIIWKIVYACDFETPYIRRAEIDDTLRRATISDALVKKLEAFLVPLDYSGPCNVDCTWDADERLMVFEINPRLGGSLMRPANATDLADCLAVVIANAT